VRLEGSGGLVIATALGTGRSHWNLQAR